MLIVLVLQKRAARSHCYTHTFRLHDKRGACARRCSSLHQRLLVQDTDILPHSSKRRRHGQQGEALRWLFDWHAAFFCDTLSSFASPFLSSFSFLTFASTDRDRSYSYWTCFRNACCPCRHWNPHGRPFKRPSSIVECNLGLRISVARSQRDIWSNISYFYSFIWP